MINIKFKTLAFCLVLAINFGCTNEFEEINKDPYNVYDEQLERDFQIVGGRFNQALSNIYTFAPISATQLQQNLIGDIFSGYMMSPTPFAGNSNNMTYDLVPGWNEWPWNIAYRDIMAPMRMVEMEAERRGFKNFLAWAKIVKVAAMHRVSDIYGPIIYSKFGELDEAKNYDCQESVYDTFFQDLESAIEILTPFANDFENDKSSQFAVFDISNYQGNYVQWVKFANSLRLRLAIRVSNVDPERARKEAEGAISHEYGVITSNEDNFLMFNSSHPLNTISNSWNDIRMGASMESIMTGYEDPRVSKFFQIAEISPEKFKGIRQGIEIQSKDDYVPFSRLAQQNAVTLLTATEIYFLRAEGALRGWEMDGSAEELYEDGIQYSFDQHNLGDASNYYSNNEKRPIDYVDPFNEDNNISAVSKTTIAWENGDSFEKNLERIITQKWIAIFPEGQEAWSEFRRTGYPKLFPVVINNSGGSIDTKEFIKRIPFAQSDVNTNPNGVEAARNCSEINGKDNGGTPLWWDVD